MTEIITRAPLQALSMSSSQRAPRQKASRRADFEDEGARSSKKIKTDATLNSTAKPTQGRKQGNPGKKTQAGTWNTRAFSARFNSRAASRLWWRWSTRYSLNFY